MHPDLQQRLTDYVDSSRERLISLIADLVRHRSENTPPVGQEGACQQYVASVLSAAGWTPDTYELGTVPGLHAHPVYVAGRDYAGRPNVGARRMGAGKGR